MLLVIDARVCKIELVYDDEGTGVYSGPLPGNGLNGWRRFDEAIERTEVLNLKPLNHEEEVGWQSRM